MLVTFDYRVGKTCSLVADSCQRESTEGNVARTGWFNMRVMPSTKN
jgi:hypothetical protein